VEWNEETEKRRRREGNEGQGRRRREGAKVGWVTEEVIQRKEENASENEKRR
jgi:hypothetical protein